MLWLLAIGLVAGLLARLAVPGRDSTSLLATLAFGVAGSLVGGLLFGTVTGGLPAHGSGPAGLVGSVVGALVVPLVHDRWTARRTALPRDRRA